MPICVTGDKPQPAGKAAATAAAAASDVVAADAAAEHKIRKELPKNTKCNRAGGGVGDGNA